MSMTIRKKNLLVAVCQSIATVLTGCSDVEQDETSSDVELRYFYKITTIWGVPHAGARLEDFYPEDGAPGFPVRNQVGLNTIGHRHWHFGLGGVRKGMSLVIGKDGSAELNHDSMEQVRVEWGRSTQLSGPKHIRHTGTIVMREL